MPMIQQRKLIEVNTDPQRRCYYGCHASSELIWTAWEDLDEAAEDKIQAKLEFWKELNDYANEIGSDVGNETVNEVPTE